MAANHELGALSAVYLRLVTDIQEVPAPPRKCPPNPLVPPGVTRPKSHMVAKNF